MTTKPRKRPQQSLDDKANYDAQRRTFEGIADIKTHPTSQAYRDGWDRIFGPREVDGSCYSRSGEGGDWGDITWDSITGTSAHGVLKNSRKTKRKEPTL